MKGSLNKPSFPRKRESRLFISLGSRFRGSDGTGLYQTSLKLIALALLLAHNACADDLGRLFFTTEQRAQLEQRHTMDTASGVAPSAHRLNGIVQKHGGTRTVWIDGVAHNANEDGRPDAASVNVPGNSRPLLLKVGQRVATATGNE